MSKIHIGDERWWARKVSNTKNFTDFSMFLKTDDFRKVCLRPRLDCKKPEFSQKNLAFFRPWAGSIMFMIWQTARFFLGGVALRAKFCVRPLLWRHHFVTGTSMQGRDRKTGLRRIVRRGGGWRTSDRILKRRPGWRTRGRRGARRPAPKKIKISRKTFTFSIWFDPKP